MLSCCGIGKVVVGVLPNVTEDQKVGSEVEDGCVGQIFEEENILSGGEAVLLGYIQLQDVGVLQLATVQVWMKLCSFMNSKVTW